MLIQHLKQLQADNLVSRKAEPIVPPFVTYKLTQSGEELTPILNAMAALVLPTIRNSCNKNMQGVILAV